VELTIHVDGGARGNPGPAGAGVVIAEAGGRQLFEAGFFLGKQTNNAAEYTALIRALERAADFTPEVVTIYSDSELLVRQITGEYRVKNPKLAVLYGEVQRLLMRVGRWSIRHVRREQNARADELANMAMDQKSDAIVLDVDGGDAPPPARSADPPTKRDPAPASKPAPVTSSPARKRVQITIATPPDEDGCPAGSWAGAKPLIVEAVLPAGMCVHAAHAILPTLLAMLGTSPEEFAAVPTMTVRCAGRDCGAVFQLSPVIGGNGRVGK
jgi:ribonuclease HI